MDRTNPSKPVNQPVRLRMYFTTAELKAFGASDPAAFSASGLSVIKYAGPARDGMFCSVPDTGMPVPPSSATTGTEFGVQFVEFAIDGFSEFWIGMYNSTMPVELFDFSVVKTPSSVQLAWSTATEMNCGSFLVERSADGIHYTAIAFLAAAGNSMSKMDYGVEDKKPVVGTTHYRLKLIDQHGTTRYASELFV